MDKDFPKTDLVAALEVVFDGLSMAALATSAAKELTESHRRAMLAKLATIKGEIVAMGNGALLAGDVFGRVVAEGAEG